MYLLAPCIYKQLNDRSRWFKSVEARELAQEKGVQFGFELKGEPETILEAPPLFWGYHLPDYFLSQNYYHQEQQDALLDRLKHLSKLKPNYLNVHGAHFWTEPLPSDDPKRYVCRTDSDSYLKVLDSNIAFLQKLKKLLPETTITVENYPPYELYLGPEGEYLPKTFLYTGTGRLFDLLYLKEKAGVEVLIDTEHLLLTLNFLNRENNFENVPLKKLQGTDLSEITKLLHQIYGFYIREGYYPYNDPKVNYNEAIAKFKAKFYHVTGSTREITGQRITSHAPIEDSPTFDKIIDPVLAQNPETLLVETADSSCNKCWSYLRSNEIELSFYEMCKILNRKLDK